MKRRKFIQTTAITAAASLLSFPFTKKIKAQSSHKKNTDTKAFLFFDLWKLDHWNNVDLKQAEPEFVPESIYEDHTLPGEGPGKPNIFFDNNNKVWRMIYNLGWSPVGLMSAISEDGIHWQIDPHPEIKFPDGRGNRLANHHIFNLDHAAAGGMYIDDLAKDGFPYKIYVQRSGKPVFNKALHDSNHYMHEYARKGVSERVFHEGRVIVSEDGLNWHLHPNYYWARPGFQPEPPYFGFYNSKTGKHHMTLRPGWGDRRVAMQTTEDFINWSEPELLLQMDPLDKAAMGFYAMPVVKVRHMYVGLMWTFHNSSSRLVDSFNLYHGKLDNQLSYSYNGIHFNRGLRESFLKLNPFPQHGCTQLRAYSIIEKHDKIRIYSGAVRAPHGMERVMNVPGKATKAIVMHQIRKDSWMYLQSKGHWAKILTKPLAIFSGQIYLNAQAPFGEVRYQLTDEKSVAIDGFTYKQCIPLKSDDQMKWPLRWNKGHIEQIKGKVVRLEMEFHNANIYALYMDYHMLDAEDMWLIKENQDIHRRWFDY